MLVKPGSSFNLRLAAGGGVFAPTPFTEETEVVGLARLRPISLRVERARSVSVDAKESIGGLELDASVHRSIIDDPVALRPVDGVPGQIELINASGPTKVEGFELFARNRHGSLSATASYALLRGSEVDESVRRDIPLNPGHTAGLTLVWEEEDDTRVGVEAYYTGRQALADDPYRTASAPYVFIDAVAQQRFGRIVVFLHGENLNNVRQGRFDPLLRYTPGMGGRWTTDVWAPLEGRVINLGIKWMY